MHSCKLFGTTGLAGGFLFTKTPPTLAGGFSDYKKEPAGLAGGSALTPVRLKVPANALRAYNNLTGRRLLATRERV